MGFEPCKRAIAKIAKEGRKYGVALCIVSQRPAEVDPTILSQCNTVFALRMSNDRDQEIVTSAITDTGSGLLEFLPSLGQREALAFGDGVALPVRIKFDELPADCLPRSTTAHFTEHWQRSVGDEGFLEQVVEKWRSSDIGAGGDFASPAYIDSFAPEQTAEPPRAPEPRRPDVSPPLRREPEVTRPAPQAPAGGYGNGRPISQQPTSRPATLRREGAPAPQPQEVATDDVPGSALKSLRDRLIQRQQR
jgi:DNA segregation ATPase FtsK/SpoIIIE-like protein